MLWMVIASRYFGIGVAIVKSLQFRRTSLLSTIYRRVVRRDIAILSLILIRILILNLSLSLILMLVLVLDLGMRLRLVSVHVLILERSHIVSMIVDVFRPSG